MKVLSITALAAAGLVLTLAGCGATSAPSPARTAGTTLPATPVYTPAAAVPEPKGTYTGSCDYTLGDDPAGGTAVATGEVDLVNTGNVGVIDKVTIRWPQEGYAPLTATKTVHSAYKASTPVPFNLPLTSTQLDNLQNYEMGHMSAADYCTYDVTIMATYGPAH